MEKNEKIWPFILTAILIVFAVLRGWQMADSCLWFDEIFSVHAAIHPWSELFGFVAQDLIHPPLFYVLLKIWILIGGENLFWLRLFPVFWSVAALVPFIFLGRDLKLGKKQIGLAVGILAVSGSLIKYAQEVRMYSLFFCLGVFSLWLFVRFFYLGKNIWLLTLVNVLLVYTHYFGWFVILAEITAIVFLQRIKMRQIFIMSGIALVSFAPWSLAVYKFAQTNAGFSQNIGWIGKPDLGAVFLLIFDLIEPFYFQQSNVEPTSNFYLTIPLLLIFLTAGCLYLIDRKRLDEREKQNLYLLLIFIFVPVLTAFALSWILPYSIWGTRHLIVVFAPLAIITAVWLTDIKSFALKISLPTLFLSICFFAFLLHLARPQPVYIWCAWENLASGLDQKTPAKIYVFEDLVAYNFWYALHNAPSEFEIVKVGGIEELKEDTAYFIPRGFNGVRTIDESSLTDDRFFIAFRDANWNLKHPPLKSLIDKGYRIGEPKVFETPGLKAFLVEVSRK